MNVFVTGGAGYIGSHTVRCLLDRGHSVVVYDDLSHGHQEAVDSRAEFRLGSLQDTKMIRHLLQRFQVDAVLHFAAFIEVGESVRQPGLYYHNNVVGTLNLLRAMNDQKVRKIVFSSTAAVYGNPERTPIQEMDPCFPINPYGRSKWMSEMIIHDFHRAYEFSAAILRYFNVAGAWPEGGMGEDHQPESHLIPRILKSALNTQEPVRIFGVDYPTPDGTCLRDYLHVVDLAQAHILALENLGPQQFDVFNVGSQSGFSVREVVSVCEEVIGKRLSVIEEPRRPGDPAVLIASQEKIRQVLNWNPRFPRLHDIVTHAWNWHRTHPEGYRSRPRASSDHEHGL
ncbi:MAG: UDP-glucose 4-epimerase GalE [Bdellovibrionales bacterium]